MEKLSEYLKKNIESVDLDIAKRILEVYREFERKTYSDYCHVCGEQIKLKNQVFQHSADFNTVCINHVEARNMYNLQRYRADNNIEFVNPYDL